MLHMRLSKIKYHELQCVYLLKMIEKIAKIRNMPTVTISVDISDYYDIVTRYFASMHSQLFEPDLNYILAFLVSFTHYSCEYGQIFQGMLQGNEEDPDLWMIISMFLIKLLWK